MRATILQASFTYLAIASADQILLQQGVDTENTLGQGKGGGPAHAQQPAPAPVPVPPPPAPSHFGGYLGCFKDTADRDVAHNQGSGFSRDGCINKCREGGYKIASLQWMSYCFCDDDYGYYGAAAPQECNKKCTVGDTSLTCGGGWRNSVYAVPYEIGCYKDSPARDVALHQGSGYSRDSCLNKCRDLKKRYAGLQWYSHCFCDDDYGNYGKRPDSECNRKCTVGDTSVYCGGPWRNSVYEMDTYTYTLDPYYGHSWCKTISTNYVPAPSFVKKRVKLEATFGLCWGPNYGTRIVVTVEGGGWSVTGQVIWPFDWIDGGHCFMCSQNQPAGFVTICRDYFGVEVDKFGVKAVARGLRICLGIGVSFTNSRTDFSIEISAGPLLKFVTPGGTKIQGSALLTGTCTLIDVTIGKNAPYVDWLDTTFQVRAEGKLEAPGYSYQYRLVLYESGDVDFEDIKNLLEPLNTPIHPLAAAQSGSDSGMGAVVNKVSEATGISLGGGCCSVSIPTSWR